jgi:hypothetical protein
MAGAVRCSRWIRHGIAAMAVSRLELRTAAAAKKSSGLLMGSHVPQH